LRHITKFFLVIALFQIFVGPVFGDKIDMRLINQVSREDFNFGSFVLHTRTDPKKGYQIKQSEFSFLGEKSLKFTIEKGDCFKKDCDSDRERVEIKAKPKEAIKDREFWYRVAFYVPKETPVMWPMRYSIWQIKVDVEKEFNEKGCEQGRNLVLLYMSIKNNGIALSRHGDSFCKEHRDFFLARHFGPQKDAFGKWIDVTIHVGFYEDPKKGFIKAYIDSSPKRKFYFRGSMYKKGMLKANIRTGIYNTFVSKSPDRGKRELYIDALGSGRDCQEVQTTEFCSNRQN